MMGVSLHDGSKVADPEVSHSHLIGLTRHWPLGDSHCLKGRVAYTLLFLSLDGAGADASS